MKFRILIAFFFIVGLVWSQNEVTPPVDTFPKDSIPVDSVSLDSIPLDSLPLDTIPVDTLPMDSLLLDTIPVDSLPMDSLPLDTILVDSLPVDSLPLDTIPVDTIIVDTLPMDTIPVDTVIVDTVIIDTIPSIEMVNIENPAVAAYMADSTYFFVSDYDSSIVMKYATPEFYSKRRDIPNGKVVTWTPSDSTYEIAEIRITVSENDVFVGGYTYNPKSLDVSSYTIYNLLPSKYYYYKVEEILSDSSVIEKTRGEFRTVGQVRMINVDGCRNVRDFGGWKTQFGTRIRYGKLFRSGNLDDVTPWGINDFKNNLNVTAELDLRGVKQYNSTLGPDVKFISYNNGYYYGGLSKYGSIYLKDFNWIIARMREGRSVDWHCQIGCDRCGTFSFLIGGLLGMTEIDLCRDYEMSSFADHVRPRSFDGEDSGTFASLIPYIKFFGPEDDLAQCFYNYFVNIGVKPEDIEYFRSEMLEEIPVETGGKQVVAPMSAVCTTPTSIQSPLRIYSINGMLMPCLQKGINIVVGEDGSVSKCYIK